MNILFLLINSVWMSVAVLHFYTFRKKIKHNRYLDQLQRESRRKTQAPWRQDVSSGKNLTKDVRGGFMGFTTPRFKEDPVTLAKRKTMDNVTVLNLRETFDVYRGRCETKISCRPKSACGGVYLNSREKRFFVLGENPEMRADWKKQQEHMRSQSLISTACPSPGDSAASSATASATTSAKASPTDSEGSSAAGLGDTLNDPTKMPVDTRLASPQPRARSQSQRPRPQSAMQSPTVPTGIFEEVSTMKKSAFNDTLGGSNASLMSSSNLIRKTNSTPMYDGRIEIGKDPLSTMYRVKGAGASFRMSESRFDNIHYNKKSKFAVDPPFYSVREDVGKGKRTTSFGSSAPRFPLIRYGSR